jgi:hypothetical protein
MEMFSRKIQFFQKNLVFPEKSSFSRKIQLFQKNPVFPEKSSFSKRNPVFPEKSSFSRKIQFFPEKFYFSRIQFFQKNPAVFVAFVCALGPGKMRWLNGLVGDGRTVPCRGKGGEMDE